MLSDIRPAREDEAAACRALLPEAFAPFGWAPELFIAATPDGIAGALAMQWAPRGFPILLYAAADFRDQDIARRLVECAAATASGETAALRAWAPLDEGSAPAATLLAAGFKVTRRLLAFETHEPLRFENTMTALAERMANKIPEDVVVVRLADAPAEGVVHLVTPQFASLPHDIAWRIRPGAHHGYDRDVSLVLMRGTDVLGAMLVRRSGDLAEVDVNVVAPAVRGRWANVLLLEGMARRARMAGVKSFHFFCEEHVRDTVNLARRSGARDLPPRLMLTLPLG